MLLALISLLTGCNPQDAEVSGTYFAWLAANSSATVEEGRIDGVLEEAARIDCVRTEDDPGYIGNSDESFDCEKVAALTYYTWPQDDGYYGITGKIEPWRTEALLTSEGDFQITTHVELGRTEDFRFHFTIAPDFAPTDCVEDESGNAVTEPVDGADWVESWSADEDGYKIYYLNAGSSQINPNDQDTYWYLTSEWLSGYGAGRFGSDDLSSIPGIYDWVDPNGYVGTYNDARREFQCKQGEVTRLNYPGNYFDSTPTEDAVGIMDPACVPFQYEDCSLDEDGEVDCTDMIWICPCEAYGSETCYPTADLDPNQISEGLQSDGSTIEDGWEDDYAACLAGQTVPGWQLYSAEEIAADMAADLQTSSDEWAAELTDVLGAQVDGEPAFDVKVEDNSWRASDDVPVGLDRWAEAHTSWVRVKDGSKIEPGGTAEGDFQIIYQASESASYVLVTGTWKVEDIQEDKWGYEELEEVKLAESGASYCGG